MDLPLYLLFGLATSGYLLKQKQEKKKRPSKRTSILPPQPDKKNIINNAQFDRVHAEVENQAAKFYNASQDGGGSGVVPFYYRWLETSDLNRRKNPDYNPNIVPPELRSMLPPGNKVSCEKMNPNTSSPTQLGGVQTEQVWENAQLPEIIPELENSDQNWAPLPFNLNGDIDSLPRGHNNMVPFFGSNLKQNMDPDNVMAATKLENFTGDKKLNRTRKQEVEPLFAPAPQNLDQLIPLREDDRYVPSNLGKRNNELPFKQESVGPGINAGYTATPSGGFHNRVRIMPKDNDALHVNPRTTHEGRVIRGKNPVDARTSQGLVYKYRPENLVTNFDGERNLVTTGAVKNPTARPRMEIKPTARQQFTDYYGGRGRTLFNKPENLFSKHKPSDRQNFKNTPYRNMKAIEGEKHHPDHIYNYENRCTERAVSGPRFLKMITNLKAAAQKAYTAYFDSAKKTKAESYIYHPRESGGNVKGKKAGVAYNPNNTARTTGRETIEAIDHTGHMRQSAEKGPVAFPDEAKTTTKELLENNDYQGAARGTLKNKILNTLDQAKTTHRETTEANNYQGIGNVNTKSRCYNEHDVPKTTVRETTENANYQGIAGIGKAGKTPFIDSAKTTTRETTEVATYSGVIDNGRKTGPAYNQASVAKTTNRETMETNSYNGQLKPDRKAPNTQFIDKARTTTKETTENADYLAGVSTGTSKRAPNTQFIDQARTTVKETTENADYLAGVSTSKRAPNTQFTDQARTTVRETTENGGRIGTISKGRKGPKTTLVDQAKTTHRETTENGDRIGTVNKGRKAPKTTLVDQAKTTHRETTEQCDHKGTIKGSKRGVVYNESSVAKTTHRETTEAASRIGAARDPNQSDGKGYLVARFEDKPTQRQFSHFSYTGTAAPKGLAESQRLYDDAYNARTNTNKEKVAKGRDRQNGNLSLHSGKNNTNIQIKKLDNDRKNHYGFAPNPVFANSRIPETVCRITSFKNNPPSEYTRLDTSLVESLLENPLTHSLHTDTGP